MRYLLVNFTKKIANDAIVYIYTTAKSYSCDVETNGQTAQFSVTFWDGKPKDAKRDGKDAKDSITMWLSDKFTLEPLTKEQAFAFKEVYGKQCVLAVDADDNFNLMSLADFNLLSREDRNFVVPSVFASSPAE